MNIIHIAGHLGADPETRFTSSGQKVTTLRVATKSRKSGQDKTIWWRVTVWGDQFDKMISFLKKGSPIIVVGEMQPPEIFNNKDGSPQVSMSITAMSLQFSPFGRSDRNNQEQSSQKEEDYAPLNAGMQSGKNSDINNSDFNDEDIPF